MISHSESLPDDSTVDSLIDSTKRAWKLDLLQNLFWLDEVDLIKSIPIGDSHNQNKLIWHHTKNGF